MIRLCRNTDVVLNMDLTFQISAWKCWCICHHIFTFLIWTHLNWPVAMSLWVSLSRSFLNLRETYFIPCTIDTFTCLHTFFDNSLSISIWKHAKITNLMFYKLFFNTVNQGRPTILKTRLQAQQQYQILKTVVLWQSNKFSQWKLSLSNKDLNPS